LTSGDLNPPEHWRVLYDEPLLAWLDTRPSQWRVDQVVAWIDHRKITGPPSDAVVVRADDPDRFYAVVPRTEEGQAWIVVEYVLVDDGIESLIVVKDIG